MSNSYTDVSGKSNEVISFNEVDADKLSSVSFDIDVNANTYNDEKFTLNYIKNLFSNIETIFTNCKTIVDSATTYINTAVKIDSSLTVPDVVDFDFNMSGGTTNSGNSSGYYNYSNYGGNYSSVSDISSGTALAGVSAVSTMSDTTTSGATIAEDTLVSAVLETITEEIEEENGYINVGILKTESEDGVITLYSKIGEESTALNLKPGTLIQVVSTAYFGWAKVIHDGKEYFVKNDSLENISNAGRLTVTFGMKKVPLYVNKDSKIEDIVMMDDETLVEIIGKTNDGWLNVKYDGKEYFVDETNIEIVTVPSEETVPIKQFEIKDTNISGTVNA